MGLINETTGASAFSLRAIRAAGALVAVDAEAFLSILSRMENPMVLYAERRLLRRHAYLCHYKGFSFYVKSWKPIELPDNIDLMRVQRIWIPD